MTNTEELTSAEEYADRLIATQRLGEVGEDEPEWLYESRITFIVDELVRFCVRTSGWGPSYFNRDSLDRLARERLDGARR